MSGSQDKNPFADQNYGKDLNSNGSGNPFSDPDYGKEKEKGFLGQAKDHAVSFFGKGAVGVGETAVGLSNMMSDGATGKILSEKLGYDPKAAKNVMTGWQSEQYQQQLKDSANIGNRKIEEGDDFATQVGKKFDNAVDITKNAINNPSLITNTVLESLPSMFLGGVLGRASGIANPVVAGAVGEGAVMAGSQAEQIRQETVDGRLTADQSLASVGTGALGGLFGYAGGRLAQKMGLSDVDTAMQTGRLTTQQVGEEIAKTPMRAIPTAVIKGAISEGFLEELPQSVSEQILQNMALDRPWHDGVENAAVMGTLAGMAMGGTVSGVGKTGDWWNSRSDTGPQDNQQQSGSPNLPSAPSQLGSNPDSALTGEYIPRGNVPQGDNQGRTAFIYDQPSMDADNLLNNNYKGDTGFDTSGNFGPSNNPDSPLSPSGGNYFDDPVNQPQPQLPSERLGINPNDGPMSSAAALAVDSGASPIAQLGYTPEQQSQEQSNTPISDAVPSNYQSLLGSQNDGQPFNANLEDATAQQGNAQADNAGKSISQQYDANAANAMGGAIETDTAQTTSAQTVQPILGQDGKNKWFGTQDKAQAFIDKKDLGNDYQVVQDGKRFEIQPKAKSPVQDDAYFQSQLDQLDKQRAQFEATGDYANAEKVYAEMQTVAREWQTNSSTDTPATNRAEPSKGASDNAWADFYRKNRNMISEELFMGGHQDRNALEEATPEIQSRHAHGMAKATPAAAVRDLKDILENDIDQNRGQGRLFTAPLSQGKLTAEQRSAMSASGTSSGSAYSDGAFTLIAKEGVGDIRSVSEIDAVMVNSAVPQEVVNGLRQDFPNMKFGYAKELPSLLSGGKQSNNAQAQVAELEQQLKNEKSVPKKAQIRKQIAELQNGLSEQAQSTVSLTQPQKDTVENLSGEFKKIEEPTNPIKKMALKGISSQVLSGNRSEVEDVIKSLGITEDEIASIQPDPKDNFLDTDFKYLPTADRVGVGSDKERAIFLPKTKGKKGQWQKIEDDYVLAMDGGRFVDLPKMTREQAIQLSNRDGENKYYDVVPRAYADHLGYKAVADNKNLTTESQPQNTASEHPVNKWQAEMQEALSKADPEHPLFKKLQASAKNGLRSVSDRAVALRQAREIEKQADAPKSKAEPEQPKVEANEQRESKIQSFINKWNQLKENGTASELDNFHKTVKIALNGYAQGKGVVAEFEQLKADIENFAKDYNKLPKTEQSTNTGPSAAETSTEQITTEIDSEATKTEATQKPKVEVSENRLVSDDRAAELRARLKAKLSQLNSGIDPEIMAIGAELAVYHIERGARKFAAFAKNIAADLDVSVEKIRPYLRSWYNGARDMMEDMGADIQGMDNAETVRAELEKLKSNKIEQSQENDDSVSYESNNPESEAAEPVVHVEGKKKEEATSNVVEKSLNKAQAKLESEQYKEMLNGLVSDVQNAIAQAPNVNPPTYEFSVQSGNNVQSMSLAMPMLANGDANAVTAKMVMDNAIKRINKYERFNDAQSAEARANRFIQELQKAYGDKPTHITFDVKGDGKFTVRNNKDSLINFLKKVQSNAGFKPIPKKRDLSTPSFNKINALKAMLSDKDEFTELNAYNMAKASGMPIIFGITRFNQPLPLYVVGEFGNVGGEKLYHTILQSKQGYDNQVSTENGGPLGVGISEKEVKAKANNHLKPENIERVKTAIAKWNKENGGIQDKLKAEYELYLNNKYGLGSVEENTNEQPTSNTSDPQGTSTVRGGRGRTSQSNVASGNNRNVDEGVSTGSGASNQNQSTGRSRIRNTGTDVENDAGVSGRGMESSRRKDASGTGQLPVDQPTRLESPAAVANTATDFYMADPELIIGGTQVKRFDKNKAALELLEELTSEGRQATTEEQAILAGYTGWGSFGQDLFQGTWDKPVFKDESVWKERNLWLRERLGKEAWESAKDSTINAHFTDPYTVAAMWEMAEKMGFTGGRVLEPAIGTGNFISLMPMHIKQRSQVTGIDLDITTAAIAKQLFPESNVQNMPYQKSKTPDNFYDLVISNVPFADIKIADRRYNQFNPNLHDYYFLKMLDQVRPGGIVMAITSSGTMDKQSEVIRRELAKKAELITSVRLPSGAFQEYAGTAVVTDIIVLRKRAEPLTMTPDEKWIKSAIIITPSGKPVTINSFFALNPQNILGTIDYGSGTTRFGAGMIVHRPHDLKQRLEKAANFVPEDALLPRHREDHLTYYANKAGERTNTLTISNGELMFVYGDQMVKATDLFEYKLKDAKKTAQRQKSIEDLIAIRKAYTDLTDAERTEQDNVEQLRKTLNKLYQAYTKEHGPLADSFGLQYFKKLDDAYYYSLAALEVNGKPAEILKRSVVRGADTLKNPTVSDAFVVERNKTTIPSLSNIAKLANVSEDQARAELIAKGAIYVLPNGDIMPSDMYLSGNVRLKLEEAQNAVAEGNTDLQRNVDALKEIIPEDIPYFNIEAKMGATWVPLSDYEKYIAHMLGMTDTTGITVTFPNGKWKVKLDPIAARRTEAKTNYGTIYKSFQTVASAALSNQTITVKYKNKDGSESVDVQATEEVNERISKIKEDFAAWLWSDPERRVQLEKEYNHTFNAWATPKYDGSFMSMQGMALSLGNGPFNLRQHQQNAIWRAIVNRRSINAHEVGTGKTFTMGGIAIESRRYGIAKKPLILAHNANSAAVAKEIQMMYPSARVLFISELGKAIRHIRMRQIANDDWDVVVMPHSMIDKLTLSEETLMAMAADDIAALEAELEEALAEEGGATLDEVLAMDSETVNKKMGFKNPTAKQLAKQRLKLLEDIQKQAMDSSKADAVNFEELGVDMIMVDEVHEFKKPSIATRMNMKGLNTSSNKRSVNLQLLTRYVRRMNNGGNVHTFTGTPITNTLTEIYHQMRYVMEEEMQKLNVAAWDGWFGSFATDITDIELSATGEYQLVTRLAGFVNVPELRKMIGQFMDIVFANDMPEMQPRKTKSGKILSDESLTEAEKAELLNWRTEGAKDRPYKKVINVTTEMSPKQEQALAEIQSLAKGWERASGKQKRQWMRDGDPRSPLSISTAAKKASYDARIGDPEYIGQEGKTEDFEMSKASQVVKNVMEVYHSHPLASQVIFADTGYNTTTERSTGQKDANGKTIRERVKVFSPIKDIVERLVQSGIPREQIAIVDGSVKAEARKAIADKMNTGEIRVVIGLTQTLGVGVNMQRNLRAMHHLDAPWMPGELEQRNGRGLRQGNQWNTVLEYRYITDKLDGKSWQVLAIKDRFINSFMKADGNVRSIEGDAAADNGEDNAGDIMSSFSEASGDPRVLQRIKMKEKLEKLQRKERLHTQGIADMKRTIGNTQRRIARIDEQIAEYENNAVLDRIQTLMQSQSENFSVEVDGKKYDKHKEASDAIQQFIVDHVRTGSSRITLGKYSNVTMSVEWDSLQPQATLSMKIGPIEFKGNTLRGIEGKLRGAAQDVKALEDARVSAQDTINNLSKAVEQPFGQADQLARTQKQLENIEQDLEINPVAPPIWLRRGAPIDSEVYYKGKLFIVSGHRYTNDGWFVSAEDAKGTIEIPYLEATDSVGMQIYEEREFEAPNIEDKTKNEEVKQPKETGSQQDPLYSRKSGNQKTGKTIAQVREALIKRFGKATIEALEKQGKLEIIQDYQVEGVEGYYRNGKAVLVASNLTDDTIIPTFLHELGGHAGFQNMMKPEQYADLMQQFERMVKQGNPIALEAKKLAEREQGSERQQLEYLPYLLTLASNTQIKNAIHKGSVTRLINDLISKVKAWIYDRLGVNINLNPNDMVALAERMVAQAMQAKANTNDAENANSPLYSRQSMQDTIDKIGQNLKSLTFKSVKDKAGDKKIDWLGIGLSALGRRQLTEIYAKLLPQLSKYNELAAQMDADKNDAGAKADSIVREWSKLNKKIDPKNPKSKTEEEFLAELMHDSTLAKIDPTKPYVSGDSISKYNQLRDAYNSLSPEAQAMYVKARDAYKQHYAEVHQAIKERILRSELSNQKKADLLKQMDDNFFGQVKGVYFPLARFGKYIVVMRNQNGEVESVSRAETMGEARALRSELMKKYPEFIVKKPKLDKEYNKSRDAVGRGFMSSLFAEVDNLGLSTAEQAEFEDTLSQLYLSSMPDLSWAKHGIHRKGTAGFSQNARRAFAQNMFSGANYLAKLRYGDQLAQQLDEMQKYADEKEKQDSSYDQPTAQSVIDEMNKRHDNLMNPKGHPLSSALTSLGFIYYLGLSPAAAMVNLSQTVLVAYPLMGAKWDFDKAGKELLKAAEQFRKSVEFHKVKWEGTKTDLYKAVSADISKFLNEDEKKAYQKAVDSGVIDVTQAHDLAGIAQGEDSGVMWKTRPIMRAASVMFHSAERFNREVTFIAAYRLARQHGADHDSAFDQAVDMTYKGHFDYSSGNRPRIMQGNVAKVVLLFKQFGQNMLYTLARQTYQSIKGETEAERKEARKALRAILAMHAIFAGVLGLPFPIVGMLLSVASWMGGDDDEPWDAEVALRNYLAEAFGPTISNMLMKGAPRGIGVDISSRVGINNLLLPDVQEGLEGKKLWDSAASAALGPIGGIGANVAKGAQEISDGHTLRGVETMLPVFLKNFAKTYRYADEGVQDKTGVSILDEVDSMDLLIQGMGFSPADVRTANEGKSAIYQLDRKLNERRSRLMTLWSRAKMMDDQQEMDEIWEEIQGFNEKNPSRRITRINLNQSYRNRQRRIDRAEDGVYLPRNRQDARDAGYFAFGE